MSWFFRIIFGLLVVLFLVSLLPPSAARATSDNDTFSKESKLRASYFLNFIKFITWPNHSEDIASKPLYICLQDETPFENFFRDLISNVATANNKPELRIYRLSEAKHCDYTYLYRPIQDENLKIIEGSVVVLSSDQISHKDAAIIFYIDERKMRFEIDLNTIKKLNVMVSSELLKLARIK